MIAKDGGSSWCDNKKCKIRTYHMCEETDQIETNHGPLGCVAYKRHIDGRDPLIVKIPDLVIAHEDKELFASLKKEWPSMRDTIFEEFGDHGEFEAITGKDKDDIPHKDRIRIANFVTGILGLAFEKRKRPRPSSSDD